MKPTPIIANNDWFLNELYDFLIEMDVTILSANYSRYVVDLNRIITEPIIGEDYNKSTIYSKTIWGSKLYEQLPDENEIERRLQNFYYPYHNKLEELINIKLKEFGKVFIIDLHSGYSSTGDKDICLGNANNEMADAKKIEEFKSCLEKVGYTVGINTPVTGGKVLRKYHKNNRNIECMIFELNFKKYIENRAIGEEEVTKYDTKLFNNAKQRLRKAFEEYLEKFQQIKRN